MSMAGSTRHIRKRGSRSAPTRDAILEAALAAFSDRGFEAASMQQIAERADVHAPQLSYHFGSKEGLWKAAVDRAFAELQASVDALQTEARTSGDAEPERRVVRGFVKLVGRNPAFVLLMHEEGKRKGPRMRWLVDRHVKPLYELTSEVLAQAKRRGRIPADIPASSFHYILSGAISFIFHQAEECRRLSGVDPLAEENIEAHALAVEALLLADSVSL